MFQSLIGQKKIGQKLFEKSLIKRVYLIQKVNISNNSPKIKTMPIIIGVLCYILRRVTVKTIVFFNANNLFKTKHNLFVSII